MAKQPGFSRKQSFKFRGEEFSEEEFNAIKAREGFSSGGRGQVTPAVERITQEAAAEREEKAIREEIKQKQTRGQVLQEVAGEQGINLETPEIPTLEQFQAEAPNAPQPPRRASFADTAAFRFLFGDFTQQNPLTGEPILDEKGEPIQVTSLTVPFAGAAGGAIAQGGKAASRLFGFLGKQGLQVTGAAGIGAAIGNSFNFLGRGKPLRREIAERVIRGSITVLNGQVEAISQGADVPISEVRASFASAAEGLNRLEAELNKKKGLRRLFDEDDLELRSEILRARDELNLLRAELETAYQEGKIKKAKIQLGIDPGF